MPTIPSLNSTNSQFRLLPNTSDSIGFFDIETDGLIYGKSPLTTLWCVVILDGRTKTYHRFGPDQVDDALDSLAGYDILVGHNIIGYDIPALQKLYPYWKCNAQLIDTFVMGNLLLPKDVLIETDVQEGVVEKKHIGSHSLRAWGERLRFSKGDHNEWSQFSPQMLEYCERDVAVTAALYSKLVKVARSWDPELKDQRALAMEHDISQILMLQVDTGWSFDLDGALDLRDQWREKLEAISAEIHELIPPFVEESTFIPKRDNKTKGYKAGIPVIRRKETPFNPGSRSQILRFFREKYNWVPAELTEKGNHKLNDDILADLPFPEAQLLAEYFLLQKRLGQLADGDKSWLGLVDHDGLIHGSVVANGTISGRAAHHSPNAAQIPNSDAPYGPQCRALFQPIDGHVLLGSDAKALELRCLGGYLAHFDGGDYASKVIDPEVDIHTYNQERFGVENRSIAKRLIYCVPVFGTQILSVKGWLSYHQLEEGLLVLSFNEKSGKTEWCPIKAIIPAYAGELIELSDGAGFCVRATAEHRWFVQAGDGVTVKTTSELTSEDRVLINAPHHTIETWGNRKFLLDPKLTQYLQAGWQFSGPLRITQIQDLEEVFCINTRNGSFVMRQGNCLTITGNCVLYGGGAVKTGSIILPHGSNEQQRQIGLETLAKFYSELPALKSLKDQVERAINERGYLIGLDGRRLHVRSAYKGLNLLLQSAGALIMKRVGIEIYERLTAGGLRYGCDWQQNAFVHDEYQLSVLPHHIEQATELVLSAYPAAGEFLKFRCPIEGDVKTGSNWYETH